MAGLDPIIHQPVRLRIMATLAQLDDETQIGFTTLRELLGLSDGNLSAHLRKLEEVGFVSVSKAFVARKPQTYVRVTGRGRERFSIHVEALQALLGQANQGEKT